MKTALVILVLLVPTITQAGDCHVVVSKQQALVVVPYAVPVATPVAPYSYVGYQPQQGYAQQQQQQAAPPRTYADYAADYREFIGLYTAWRDAKEGREPGGVTTQAAPASLVTQHCAACHSGESAPKGFDLSSLAALTPLQFGQAVARLTTDDEGKQMPPPRKHPIDPAVRGKLLQEFSQAAIAAATTQPSQEETP